MPNFKRSINITIIITALYTTTSCVTDQAYRVSEMYESPPWQASSELYLKGWKDGCKTGAASSADNKYRYMRRFVQNWKLAQNDEYHRAWKEAYNYCRKNILHRERDDRPYTIGK